MKVPEWQGLRQRAHALLGDRRAEGLGHNLKDRRIDNFFLLYLLALITPDTRKTWLEALFGSGIFQYHKENLAALEWPIAIHQYRLARAFCSVMCAVLS
jgi:hypothetical protein